MQITPFEALKMTRQLRFWRAAAVALIFYGGGTSFIALNQSRHAATAERNVIKLEHQLQELDLQIIQFDSKTGANPKTQPDTPP